jgi:hypothetical protein
MRVTLEKPAGFRDRRAYDRMRGRATVQQGNPGVNRHRVADTTYPVPVWSARNGLTTSR